MKKVMVILVLALAVSLTGFASEAISEATGSAQNVEISKATASVVSNAGKSKKPHRKAHKKGSKAKKARK